MGKRRMEFIFGDIAMTLSPEDMEFVISDWQARNPGKNIEQMPPSEFADGCMKRLKASARPTRTVIHN